MSQSSAAATQPFAIELGFTDVFRRYEHAPRPVREAACLRAMFPHNLRPIHEGDLLAGRIVASFVGFALEPAYGGTGFYCRTEKIRSAMEGMHLAPEQLQQIEQMLAYWQTRTTTARHDAALPVDVKIGAGNAIAHGGPRLAGCLPDYDQLVQLGLPGLRQRVRQHKARAAAEGRDGQFYDALEALLDLLADISRYYAAQARQQAADSSRPTRREELLELAGTLERIVSEPPRTLHEAMQLFWLYIMVSGVVNYGRMDVFLGDFYCRDVDGGVLGEAKALRLVQSLWQLMADRKIAFNGRVITGGRGRRNEANADRFALLAMEATRTVIETEPQLTLRFYRGQNPALMEKALTVIGEGRTYPMLYNDDVNIPAVEHAFGVGRADAEKYIPYGCGEYALDHTSLGSPNCAFNLLKALEVTLRNGRDGVTGQPLGLETGPFAAFASFDALFAAYKKQVEQHAWFLARRHKIELEVEAAEADWLAVSLLYDGCIEKGRSVMAGGAKYLGMVFESFGMVNTADALTAIRRLVYERKLLTPAELLAALEANFAGHERVRKLLLDQPKFGNDDDDADRMLQQVSDHACQGARAQAKMVGVDYCLLVNVNNYFNVVLGQSTAASADGRRLGEALANGNTPTAGRDRRGVTAFLNSLVKIDSRPHAGYTQNMKFSRQMFREDREKLEALLSTYFARGGAQAMITVVSRGDLEAAMKEPQKYANLIVRVGGFSARFVELAKEVQLDLVARTLY